ncbi:perlucin-like [Mya arenaria]|uniref:perlucin-like n=1 Tax=Mya arenaria TaxID=6604 RepID=UPI0022E521C2|nr:perlucin-like [Mya arenaria]
MCTRFYLNLTGFMMLLFVVSAEYTLCPDGWMAEHGSCYYFNEVPHNFTEAQRACRDMGAHLVHIESIDENNFIKDRVRHEYPQTNWWIGLVDYVQEGYWMWADDLAHLQEFEDWAPGEPNASSDVENCGELHRNLNFQWNDYECHWPINSICEMNRQSSEVIVG